MTVGEFVAASAAHPDVFHASNKTGVNGLT